jgi:hypothetical protein
MTRENLIASSAQAIDRLPAHERQLVEQHFDTGDRDELLRRFADETEETWGGPSEAPVEPRDWPEAHLHMLLQVHRTAEQDRELAAQTQAVLTFMDALAPDRRALLCWRFHTTNRRWLAALAVNATRDATLGAPGRPFAQALPEVIHQEIERQVAEIDREYRQGIEREEHDHGR